MVVGVARSHSWDAAVSNRTTICGLPVDSVSTAEVVDRVLDRCARPVTPAEPPLTIFSCNVDMVVKAARDPAFGRTLASAGLLTADGMPIVWLGRALGGTFPERVTGADLVPEIARACAETGFRVFFLGAAEGVAAEAARRLQASHPGLQVAGVLSPPIGFDRSPETLQPVFEAVRAARPDVLFVALGAPRQERFLEMHAAALGAKVALGIGAAIDMAAGRVHRAPKIVQRMGAEWLWRLAREPRRLGRRYLVEDPLFAWLAIRALLRRPNR
jgi:N-acetylglucosaminyldiphosphoundecaprenol N-acetyl-beta-D-mannosaminyltransferase